MQNFIEEQDILRINTPQNMTMFSIIMREVENSVTKMMRNTIIVSQIVKPLPLRKHTL